MIIIALLLLTSLLIFIGFILIYKKYNRANKFGKKNILIIFGLFIILSVISTFIFGYRITPLAASRANGFIEKDFVLIDDLDLDWAYIHFYHDKENDKYYTTISEKKLFMYVSRFSVWSYGNSGAPIRSIGSMSYSNGKGKSAKLLLVDSNDKNIDSIIIKDEYKTIETKINVYNPKVILLDDFSNTKEFQVLAVDKNYKELYYYGYPKGTNIFNTEDYKWHCVEKVPEVQ